MNPIRNDVPNCWANFMLIKTVRDHISFKICKLEVILTGFSGSRLPMSPLPHFAAVSQRGMVVSSREGRRKMYGESPLAMYGLNTGCGTRFFNNRRYFECFSLLFICFLRSYVAIVTLMYHFLHFRYCYCVST